MPPETITAPAATAAPAADTKPAPSPMASRPAGMKEIGPNSSFADLEAAISGATPPKPKPAPKPKSDAQPKEAPEERAPQDSDFTEEDHAPEPKAPEKPAASKTVPAGGTKPVEEMQPKELRNAYRETQRKLAELEAKSKTATQTDDPEKSQIKERLESVQKRADELENEIKFVNYAKSSEYKKNFEEPLGRAFHKAYSEITELTWQKPAVRDEEGNIIEPAGPERPATKADFDALLTMPLAEAIVAAKAFGDAASEVKAHRRKIIELHQASQAAIEDFKKQATEREQKLSETTAKERAETAKKWQKLNSDAAEAYPHWFKPVEGDDAGNQFLEKGFELASKVFGDTSKMPKDEVIALHSAAFNKLGGFDRLALFNHRLQQQVKELEEKLKGYEESDPASFTSSRRPVAAAPETFEDEIRSIDKRR